MFLERNIIAGTSKDLDVILLSSNWLVVRAFEVYEHLENHSLALPRHDEATSFPLSQIKFSNQGIAALPSKYRPFLADWDSDAGSDWRILFFCAKNLVSSSRACLFFSTPPCLYRWSDVRCFYACVSVYIYGLCIVYVGYRIACDPIQVLGRWWPYFLVPKWSQVIEWKGSCKWSTWFLQYAFMRGAVLSGVSRLLVTYSGWIACDSIILNE